MSVLTPEQIDEMIMVKLRMLRAEIDTERAQAATAAQPAATQATNELSGMFDKTKVFVEEMKASHQSQLDFVKDTNDKQAVFVNEKHDQVTALFGEVSQVKKESGDVVARLRIRDEALREWMESKESDIIKSFVSHRGDMMKIVTDGQAEFARLQSLVTAGGGQGASHEGGKGKGSRLIDTRDYKFAQMPETCSTEQFKKWRHDGLTYLESHAQWSGVTHLLHELRKSPVEIDKKVFTLAVAETDEALEIEDTPFRKDEWGGGFYLDPRNIPPLLKWVPALSFTSYTFPALMLLVHKGAGDGASLGLEYACRTDTAAHAAVDAAKYGSSCPVSGQAVLDEQGIEGSAGTRCLVILLMLVIYRLIAYACLRFLHKPSHK